MTPQRTHLAAHGMNSNHIVLKQSFTGNTPEQESSTLSRRAAQEVRNDPPFAPMGTTASSTESPERVFIPKIIFVGPIDHVDLCPKKFAASHGCRTLSSSGFHNKKCLTTVAQGFYKGPV